MPNTALGDNFAFDLRPPTGGLRRQDAISTVPYTSYMEASPDDTALTSEVAGPQERPINYLWYLLGIFILLLVLKYASEHKAAKMQPAFAGIGVWNFVTVGTMSILFIVVIKTILNKYHIRGLTDLVNVV